MKERSPGQAVIIGEKPVKKVGDVVGYPGCNVTTLPLDIPLSFSRFF